MKQLYGLETLLAYCCSYIFIVAGYFEKCSETIQLGAYENYALNSPGYPRYGYMPGSSCLYTITAPQGYQINANCYINIPSQYGQCTTENFYIYENSSLSPYCGAGNLNKVSMNNGLYIAYTSQSNDLSGTFNCVLKATPQTCDCGWNINTRIVGGDNATQNEFPPMAGLKYMPGNILFCGGTIISPRFVMTAAHCLFIYNINDVGIVVGQLNIKKDDSPFYNQYYVQQLYLNPGYIRGSNINDIALLQTSSTMIWSRGVGPACLPILNSYAPFSNAGVQATGWGSVSYAGPSKDILQKVTLKVLPNNVCQSNYYSNLTNSQMCTYTSGRDSCQFDSGGPLFYSGGRLFAVGIVSYGDGCATLTPAVNTRVTSYLDWILSITGPLCQKPIM